ncbi:T9SS type A sorting domain-containing protein [Panacibacter ginsenosidivorans]|uniref:T9SS type A sorting domain-containing protein n=1 Tax=Panacibacter ginsenosidivorans TaxID=1813871 RepID=A0A5B8V887_9BACT|nr:T9SS type A sorting domain-containing protein [Panacibacter ginsenosidivorans]QEC66926.1 T9SS type A sorting domain-containing protein [Panacibacter ginsenosidivorans]
MNNSTLSCLPIGKQSAQNNAYRFMMRIMSIFILVLFSFMSNYAWAQSGAATIISDQVDYAPGTTATLTGSGFQPGETVVLQVLHYDGTSDGGEDHQPWEVNVDENGNFTATWHVCEDDCVGSTLRATADGQSSGLHAECFFTDAIDWTIALPTTTLCPGKKVTLKFTATSTGSTQVGCIRVDIPTGYISPANPTIISSSGFNWNISIITVSGTPTISVQANTSGDRISGSSNNQVVFSIDVIAPSSGSSTWLSKARTAINCSGGGANPTANPTTAVLDNNAPVPNVVALPNATGECSVTVSTAPTATDDCVGSITGTTSDALTYTNQGTYTINWNYDDGNGNISHQSQTVIVKDITAPVVPTLADVTGECEATVTAPTTTDNCAGTVTGTTSDALSYSTQGTHVIHWTFDDDNGNVSHADQNVVIDDVTAPVVPTLADVTGECEATVTVPITTDNCLGAVTGTTSDALSYSTQGTHVIHWTFDDGNGNVSHADQNVVIDDITAPVVPTLADVTGECSATASTAPTTTDNCAGTVTGTTSDALSYSTQGTHVIHWTFDDGNGNVSHADQNVVIDDITAPVVPTLADVTGECEATVTAPTTTDNCAGTVTGTTSDALSYSTQGTHVIHWTFDDGNGNVSHADQNVVIDDITAPVVPTLADVTGECEATASTATTTDNCVGAVTGTTSDALSYSTQGTHVIHWTFDDGNGNVSHADQNVVIDDITAPVVPTLADVTGECEATVTAPTTTDNCAGTVTGTTSDALSYSTQGTHVIHWTFDDGNGNVSHADQNVVIDDITAPVVPTLADVTGECEATASTATTTDNCAGTVTGTTSDALSYSTQGTHVIHWTFDDGNGNVSHADQNVVIDDITAPVVPTLADVTGECEATVTAPTTTDNCAGTVTGTTSDALSYSTQGTHVIHWTFDDGNGNVSHADQNVVIDDITAPVVPTLADVTGECEATASTATTTDNCAGTVTGTTSDALSYSTQGTHVIHWTFDDGNGNSTSANQNVIVHDVTEPAITSLPNIYLSACTNTATWSVPSFNDNCTGATIAQTAGPASGSAFDNGTTTIITYTVTDIGGNQKSCSFTITRAPAFVASSSSTAILCNGGNSTITISATGGTAPYTGTGLFTNGAGSYSYTVTDANGCTSTTTGTITQPTALTATCNLSNTDLYYGYTGDQTTVFSVKPSGGTGPYTVVITMNRALKCNQINDAGDENWIGSAGVNTIGTSCPLYPDSTHGPSPVSTKTITAAGDSAYVKLTLLADANITAIITDANGCVTTCTKHIHADDVRCFGGKSGVVKVTLCHKTGSAKNPCVTICVDEDAVAEHLAHGDFLGKCTADCLPPASVSSTAASITYTGTKIVDPTTEKLNVKILPNPATSVFTLVMQSNSNEPVEIVVADMYGKKLYQIKGSITDTYKFGNNFASGMYIVRVMQGLKTQTVKVIKTKG